jgi:L-iditol 2-dehydrogenase
MTTAAPPQTMQALALVAPRTLELRAVPTPEAGAHEALVEVTHVGLCGTDWHIWSGEANYHRDAQGAPVPLADAPQVLGHEVAGAVVAVGAEVEDLAVGDAVVLDQGLNCRSQRRDGDCAYCATGSSHQCAYYREHGITGLQGGLAGFLAMPAINAVKVRTGFDLGHAVLTEPLACVLHACDWLRATPARWTLDGRGASSEVETALVVGGGPAGLLFVQVLREVLGYEGRLLLADPSPAKRALAAGFGAEAVEDAAAALGGARAELVIDASGSGPLFEALPGLMHKQATLLLYGHGHGGVGMDLLNAVQFLEPTLVSPVGASGGFDQDDRPTVYRQALRLLETGTVQAAPLITHRFPGLEAAIAAFTGEARGESYVKGIVEVGGAA